ncbi:MAG TPA: tryptophan synthase subunit alpha [Microbacteriaceae bacterium]|nr:tryptophan synthase subunit alpha [Microbacteriaceae bacterium]
MNELVGYLPVGFPDLRGSVDAALALLDNGVTAIEFGVPYSDPVMDGPVIQEAANAALDAGFRLPHVFEAVRALREHSAAPVYVMTYWNPVVQYGVDRLADDLAASGGTGLITPDITPDAAGEWIAASERTGLDRVFLAAPTSTPQRLQLIAEASRGWVYAVSTMGVTGTRDDLDAKARALVPRIRAAGAERVYVGIGISTAAQVAEVWEYADGAIVGSAIVRAIARDGAAGAARVAAELSGA